MTDQFPDIGVLLDNYGTLLDLYTRLEVISDEVLNAMSDAAQLGSLQGKLKEKLSVVEAIQETSHVIAGLKKSVSELSGNDREKVKHAEDELTAAVDRVVAQEDRSKELFSKQGVKISRR